MLQTITINLAKHKKLDQHRESLSELLEKALAAAMPGIEKESDWSKRQDARWIARQALRAVLKEIIRTGKIPLPIKVRFAGKHDEWRNDWPADYSRN